MTDGSSSTCPSIILTFWWSNVGSLEQEMGEQHMPPWSKAGKGGVESLRNSLQHARWESLPPLSVFC